MPSITRTITVTRKGMQHQIQIVEGTSLLPISIIVSDYDILSGSAAVAYNRQPNGTLVNQACTISENTISFTPPEGFYLKGYNKTQVRVTNNNRNLFSFVIDVWCDENITDDADVEEINSQPTLVTQLLSQIGVLTARMDAFTALPEGSTTSDAALNDIRIGYDGTEYPTPGDAVRGQVGSLSEDISNVGRYILYNAFDITNITEGGFWSQTNGRFTSVQTFNACNRYVEVESNKNYYGYYVDEFGVYREATSSIIACWYDANKEFISGQYTGDTNVFLSPENAKFVRLSYINKYEVIVFTEIENIENPNTTEYLRKFITFDSEKIVNIEEKTTILEGKVLSIEETLSSMDSDLSVSYEQNEDGFLLKSADGDDELSLEVFNQKGNNNSFNFGWFKKNDINYKQMGDDIAPFFCDNTYIGSNHGNSVAFELTCENHGKTEQDIGSIYLNRSTNYIILKIIDDNTLWLLGEPLGVTYFGIYRFPTTALEGNELTHVSGGVNTSSIVFSSQTRLVQIVPCIKNKRVVYLSDGKEIENASGRCSTFTISLQYETIDLVKVYEYLKQNVGSNTNQSYYDSNIESDMIFISDFQISGKLNIVVDSYVTILRENANGYRYSVMQAEAFSTGTRKTYVPFSNYDTPQNVSSISLKIGDWKNENIPPYKFYQFDNNMENGWVIGYDILQKDTSPETRKSNLSDGTVTCFDLITGTSKMYPYTCNSAKLFQFGETYGGRAYCGRVKVVDNAVVFTYKTKNYTIVEIECFEQCELRNILLDTSLQGKNVEIVNSSGGIKILNSFVSKDGIYWLSTKKGSVTLKVF